MPWFDAGLAAEPSPSAAPSPSAEAIAATRSPSPAGAPQAPAGIDPGDGGPDGHAAQVRPAPTGGQGRRVRGPLDGFLAATGLQLPSFAGAPIAPTLVTVTGATTMAMAFGLFGRRRRHDEQPAPDDVLAAAAASGLGPAPLEAVALGMAGGSPVTHAGSAVDEQEALLPRWRRPSLLKARREDPIRDNTPAPRLTFDKALVGPLDGHERRLIRYRVVRLLDAPDELRGTEIGYLDQGDEVQLVERQGAYWLVLSPDGQQGWLHKMTLGDTVGERPDGDGPMATMPLAADSWTLGETDGGSNVLDAYLAARRREA